ncbi:MAG: tRNA methyl transferase-like protein [Gammaproteobacteria bacterium]|nr:tRNA methyl transferase-like protein [Gammaproteobacteria bacterium]
MNAMVLLSGGIDSTSCIHFLQSQKYDVSSVFVNYGHHANSMEKSRALDIADYFDISHSVIDISSNAKFLSSEIQGRNAFLIFSALMLSGLTQGVIAIGIHSGTDYYDCSELFYNRIQKVVHEYSNGRISLIAPFIKWSKQNIIEYLDENNLPLQSTYSCEIGNTLPCGKCKSCKDREAYCVCSSA